MKYYGRICHNLESITTEKILKKIPGVMFQNRKYVCNQCTNKDQSLFMKYYCHHCHKMTVYCRYCINLGKVQSCKDIYVIESHHERTKGFYNLTFELSEQQLMASSKVCDAIIQYKNLLLYAVTGAGKTEMIFEGISKARQRGDNVAIVSPRVDVVKEVYLRLKEAFEDEDIDLMYEGQFAEFNSTFVVSTVHQLMRYENHFDVVIVDEVDAFPLEMDNQLMTTIRKASSKQSSHIYLTATPNQALRSLFKTSDIIQLPARYHKHPLPVPVFIYNKIKETKLNHKFLKTLKLQIEQGRKTFVFFHDIEYMKTVYAIYKYHFARIEFVSSIDELRHEKVKLLRENKIDIIFTTTILERGITLSNLDVIIVRSDMFTSSAIIQIAGRVGRKVKQPDGKVMCYHNGITKNMIRAKHEIIQMNNLAKQKGWLI
ncbi:DEAD/DEAH box helicase family protein [Mammaliicoccus stepanovicii]|uniref:Putative ATP-dependent helicase n=1 Tax=Mammaliicoccus stepanovicii TaxID=643214 RepID=A0A239ZXQ7_9STAP|nr:DEAD/DEAH box helicase family protein [Mammaliicoccus stepanovicii]PNZ79320.1 DNA/RNA helicase [Mammaliicoccus stepanovicii]GGI39235.1 hypothetical protein GCM10010896_02370 [Mammaliicoccus stepanovicii]SNV75855.1 putative ATP-dependent helicase [Mammaliicoccus stepanovicii]